MGRRTGSRRAVARLAGWQRMGGSVTLRRWTPVDEVPGEECTRGTKADGPTITGRASKTVMSTGLGVNSDGVTERMQRTITVVNAGTGARTETVEEWHGAIIAGGVKDNRTVTVTSADGKQVTISCNHDWGGWFNERKTQTPTIAGRWEA